MKQDSKDFLLGIGVVLMVAALVFIAWPYKKAEEPTVVSTNLVQTWYGQAYTNDLGPNDMEIDAMRKLRHIRSGWSYPAEPLECAYWHLRVSSNEQQIEKNCWFETNSFKVVITERRYLDPECTSLTVGVCKFCGKAVWYFAHFLSRNENSKPQ